MFPSPQLWHRTISIIPRSVPMPILPSSYPLDPGNHWYALVTIGFLFLEFNINGIIQCKVFCDWFLSLSMPFHWIHMSCLSNQQLLDICTVSSFNLWIKLLWIVAYKTLCGYMFYFLFDKYLGLRFLGHMVGECFNILRNLPNCFPKWLNNFMFPSTMTAIALYSHHHFIWSVFLILATLVDI